MTLSIKILFSKKSLFAIGLFLAFGAISVSAQDIEPGSSVMEAKSRKPPVKTKPEAKNNSAANSKPASKSVKTGISGRAKTNSSPAVKNAKTQPQANVEKVEETKEMLDLEIVVGAAPVYPGAAKQAGAAGNVRVEVTVDEKGDVISAQAKDGHELLRASAEKAALSMKFMPRKVKGKAVKTNGYLIFCFGGSCG